MMSKETQMIMRMDESIAMVILGLVKLRVNPLENEVSEVFERVGLAGVLMNAAIKHPEWAVAWLKEARFDLWTDFDQYCSVFVEANPVEVIDGHES